MSKLYKKHEKQIKSIQHSTDKLINNFSFDYQFFMVWVRCLMIG